MTVRGHEEERRVVTEGEWKVAGRGKSSTVMQNETNNTSRCVSLQECDAHINIITSIKWYICNNNCSMLMTDITAM